MSTIRPEDAKPGEVYEGTVGGERWTMRRVFTDVEHCWDVTRLGSDGKSLYSHRKRDDQVHNLVRLVPARPVTRNDLPNALPLLKIYMDADLDFGAVLDAVVAHLNANGGVGIDTREPMERALRERDEARAEGRAAHDNWMNAADRAETAERERDEAMERVDDVLRRATHAEGNLLSMTSGRDEWKGRAEDAEQKYGTERLRWERAREHHADESRKWGEKRRAYEAQIAELEVDAADDDPIVYAVRESDVAAVKIELDSHGEPFADGEHVYTDSAADARNLAGGHIQKAIRRFAVARAIEQDAATDPITDAIRDGLNVWGTTDEGVRQIAESVRRAISNDGGENVL